MTEQNIIRSLKPQPDYSNGRLSEKRIAEIVQKTMIRSSKPAQPAQNNLADINSRWQKATGRKSKSPSRDMITSAKPTDTEYDKINRKWQKAIGSNIVTSALPSMETFDFKQAIPLSPEGQARVSEANQEYKDAEIRYRQAVPEHLANEFMRSNPTLQQLKGATSIIQKADLEKTNKKWRLQTGWGMRR